MTSRSRSRIAWVRSAPRPRRRSRWTTTRFPSRQVWPVTLMRLWASLRMPTVWFRAGKTGPATGITQPWTAVPGTAAPRAWPKIKSCRCRRSKSGRDGSTSLENSSPKNSMLWCVLPTRPGAAVARSSAASPMIFYQSEDLATPSIVEALGSGISRWRVPEMACPPSISHPSPTTWCSKLPSMTMRVRRIWRPIRIARSGGPKTKLAWILTLPRSLVTVMRFRQVKANWSVVIWRPNTGSPRPIRPPAVSPTRPPLPSPPPRQRSTPRCYLTAILMTWSPIGGPSMAASTPPTGPTRYPSARGSTRLRQI